VSAAMQAAQPFDAELAKLRAFADEVEAEQSALPCAEHAAARTDWARAQPCIAARTWRSCRFAANASVCPRHRERERGDAWGHQLRLADAPADTTERLLASVRLENRMPLLRWPALLAIRAVVARTPAQVATNGSAAVQLRGNERVIVLAGPHRIGKTLAACYALAARGGSYTLAYQYTRPGLDIEQVGRAQTLVLDLMGDEALNGFGLARMSEAIHRVYDQRGLVVACTRQLDRRAWEHKYGSAIASLLASSGAWFAFDAVGRSRAAAGGA
jgi:hypothetical protein